MLIDSQLKGAQIEALGADPSQGTRGRVWLRTDTAQIKYDDGELIRALGGGGGGSAFRWWLNANGPLEENLSFGEEVLDFNANDAQQIFGMLKIPNEFSAGLQLKLDGALFSTTAVTGTVLFKATSYLVQPGVTVLGTYPNQHISTNSAITVSGVASTVTSVGDIDITDANGEINSVAVSANDLVFIKLIRDTAVDTASADARLMRNSFEQVIE